MCSDYIRSARSVFGECTLSKLGQLQRSLYMYSMGGNTVSWYFAFIDSVATWQIFNIKAYTFVFAN